MSGFRGRLFRMGGLAAALILVGTLVPSSAWHEADSRVTPDMAERFRLVAEGRKPVSWRNNHNCEEVALPRCDALSATAQFRQWVSLLREEDRGVLAQVGLDLIELRKLAKQHRIRGVIMKTSGVETVATLYENPQVRSIAIAQVALED
ncbi:hypothetical protein [Herbidospora sp. RD11066]